MKIQTMVQNFAKESIDVYKSFVDYVNHYKFENGDLKNYTNVSGLSFEEKGTMIHKAILEEAEKSTGIKGFENIAPEMLVTNPNYKWAMFAIISGMVEMILPQTIIDSVGAYTEVRVGGFGDNFLFEVKSRDLFYVTKGAKGRKHAYAQKQFVGQVTITPEEYDIAVEVNLYRVLSGKENLAEFAMKAAKSMETEVAKSCYTAFSTAMGSLPYNATPVGTELRIAGYTQNTAVALAQKVTAYNNGAKAIFMGTKVAISNIIPNATSNYRYDIASDYVKVGYLRNIAGVDIMEIPQVADWENPFKVLLDDKKIYVISPSAGKFVKLCIEGSMLTFADAVDTNANLTQKTTMKKFFGVGIAAGAVAGLIELA